MDAMLQSRLGQALLDPDHAVALPPAEVEPFAVHRNTVTLGLLNALRDSFPTTRRLMGETAFEMAALRFLRAEPPRSPVLFEWGAAFPERLAGMPGMDRWQWIAEVAWLEWARQQAYHAADAPRSAAADWLAAASGRTDRRLALHPSARARRCHAPVVALWRSQNGEGDPPSAADWADARVLVWRRDEILMARTLDATESELLDAAEQTVPLHDLLSTHPALTASLADAVDAGWLLLLPDPDQGPRS